MQFFLIGAYRFDTGVILEKFHGTDLQRTLVFKRVKAEFFDTGGILPKLEGTDIGGRKSHLFFVPLTVTDVTAEIDVNSGKRFVFVPEKINFSLIAGGDFFRHAVLHDKEVVVTRFHRKFVDLETGVIFLGIDDEDAVFALQSHSHRTSPAAEFVGGIPLHYLCTGNNCRSEQDNT